MSLRSSNLLPHFESLAFSKCGYLQQNAFLGEGTPREKFLFLLAIFTKFGYDRCVIGYTGGQHANN